MKQLGELVKEYRERAGLTQKELADRVGIDHSYISRIERGSSSAPSREKVLAITEALKITNRAARASFLLAAGYARLDDLEGVALVTDVTPLYEVAGETIYWRSPPNPEDSFLSTKKTLDDIVFRELRELLARVDETAESMDERDATLELIRSFFAWLRVHLK